MGIETLKREVRQYTTLAMSLYDQLEETPEAVRAALAMTHDNRQARENPVRLDHVFFFPEMYRWEDEPVSMPGFDKIEWTVPMGGYSGFVAYNKVNIGRPNSAATIEAAVRALPKAYHRVQIKAMMSVLRTNPLAYDGQSFFSNAHVHPASKGTYDNTLALGFADSATPEFDEIKDLLHRARARFVTNNTIQAEVLTSAEMESALLVVVNNAAHYSMFQQVRAQTVRNNVTNEMAGTFNLMVDAKPSAPNDIEFVWNQPDGMRPAIFVPDEDPKLDVVESNRVSEGFVEINFGGMFAVKPGLPQTALKAS